MFYASIVFEIFAFKYDFFVQLVQSILKYNRGIYMQNVLLRLREVQPSLSSTERQIAQFILENPDETTTLTIRDLARRSFSSPSSVVRICRVIGFQGYKELRHALTLELATLGENGSHREKDNTPQNRQQEQQAATLGSKIEKIQNQRVDVRSIEKIVATSIPFSSKVAVEREDFDRLSTLA